MRSAILLVLLTACAKQVEPYHQVVCKGLTDALECQVVQVRGGHDAEVCFDFNFTCGNGVVVKAPNNCTRVTADGTTTMLVPYASLPGYDTCKAGTVTKTLEIGKIEASKT